MDAGCETALLAKKEERREEWKFANFHMLLIYLAFASLLCDIRNIIYITMYLVFDILNYFLYI